MKICYDTDRWVKGDRVYRVRDLIPGELYIFGSEVSTWVAKITNLENASYWCASYHIVEARKYSLNSFDMILHTYMLEKRKYASTVFEVYKAVQPEFTCKMCKSHDVPMPLQATQVINGQRVARSCNYYRCTHCNTLNRHEWVTGYPTHFEMCILPYMEIKNQFTVQDKDVWILTQKNHG